jgi:hypothetical protein
LNDNGDHVRCVNGDMCVDCDDQDCPISPLYERMVEQEMKPSFALPVFNLIVSSWLCFLWASGTETFSGGICEYWRCIDPRVSLILPSLLVLVMGNLYALVIQYIEKKI